MYDRRYARLTSKTTPSARAARSREPKRGPVGWLAAANLVLAALAVVCVFGGLVVGAFTGRASLTFMVYVLFYGAVGSVWVYAATGHLRTLTTYFTPMLGFAHLCAFVLWLLPLLTLCFADAMGALSALGALFAQFALFMLGAGALAKSIVAFAPEDSWLSELMGNFGMSS